MTRPWADIYTTDDERKMTFDAVVEFERLLEDSYEQAGYTLVEIPRGSVDDRVAFLQEIHRPNLRVRRGLIPAASG